MYASHEPYKLTVIIPTYNRADILKKCLDALSRQIFPIQDFEVIVSDDGSTDHTKDLVYMIKSTLPYSLRYWRQANQSANAARNRAIECSKGRILLFINDDTLAEPDMLSEHIRTHEEYPDDNIAVLGRVTISPDVPSSIFAKEHLDYSFGLWKNQKILDWRAFYTCNVSVKRTFLLTNGLFEEKLRYHDDVELGERLSRHGLIVIYNRKALGYHYHYLSEQEYLRLAQKGGKQLAIWYRKSPHLKNELAFLGLYLTAPFPKRFRSFLGDLVVNNFSIPGLLLMARFLANHNEKISLLIYRKICQALNRKAIRHELFN